MTDSMEKDSVGPVGAEAQPSASSQQEVRPKVHVSDMLPTYLRHTLGPILGSRPDLHKGLIERR